MPDEPLLSDLCSICYTQKPKYRCPGCKAQTCSLPCYKRHQQRASCNGKRDPAVYVKRSQLATPAGIDQDYNYLKSVERSIDHAARETQDRGVGGKSFVKGSERGLHPESLLQRYLVTNRINVERAPKGMSRQRTNRTRFTKRQNVMWTVEWIDANGQHDLQDDCLASSSVNDCYELMLQQRHNASMRRMTAETLTGSTTKRKRADVQSDCTSKISKIQQDSANPASSEGSKRADGVGGDAESAQLQLSTPSKDVFKVHSGQQTEKRPSVASEQESTVGTSEAAENAQSTSRSFYLLKPGTASASKVLIPIDSMTTLTASLQDKTLLEYPTIYVLPYLPGSLPSPYMLAEDYNKIRKSEEVELDQAIRQAQPAVAAQNARIEGKAAAADNQIDPQRILDMLKRDVTR